MGKTANKQMICEALMEAAKEDQDIVALCSDSREMCIRDRWCWYRRSLQTGIRIWDSECERTDPTELWFRIWGDI